MSDAADLDASSDTNISISQSTKEESCSREDPEASTDSKTGTSQPTTEGQSCDDKNPDVSDTTSISQSTARHESCNNEDAEASTDATTTLLNPTTENKSSNVPEAPADTSEPETQSAFRDPTVRRAFVRKVFGIQFVTLLFAVGVVCLFLFSDVIREGVRGNVGVFISSFIIFIAVSCILCCFKSYSRHHPWNLVGLALVTLTLSFMLGTTASNRNPIPVHIALGDTIMICLAIIVFNAQSRVDFNLCSGFILSVAVPLITLGITYGIFPDLLFMLYVIFGGVGAFLLSMVFVVNIQKMMGRIKNRVRPEEYVSAALLIYLDMVLPSLLIMGLLMGLLHFIIYLAF